VASQVAANIERLSVPERIGGAILTFVLALGLVGCRPSHDTRGIHSGYPPRAEDLFTIDLPVDARIDTQRRMPRIDRMPGEPNHEATWLGQGWQVDWWWWEDGRRVDSHWCETSLQPNTARSDSTLVAFTGRCYRWHQQMLRVVYSQRVPPDSLAAERLLASVHFQPKRAWR
jgi:hypothetical protein